MQDMMPGGGGKVADKPEPNMKLISMVAFIGRVNYVLHSAPLRRRGHLNTYGLIVQRRVRGKGREYYEAGGRWITQLQFSGIGDRLVDAYEAGYSAKECELVVTKYNPGEWEKQVEPTYMKAKRIRAAIMLLDPQHPETWNMKNEALA